MGLEDKGRGRVSSSRTPRLSSLIAPKMGSIFIYFNGSICCGFASLGTGCRLGADGPSVIGRAKKRGVDALGGSGTAGVSRRATKKLCLLRIKALKFPHLTPVFGSVCCAPQATPHSLDLQVVAAISIYLAQSWWLLVTSASRLRCGLW